MFFILSLLHAHAWALDNCRAPGPYVVGASSVCNIATDCIWCERNQLSFDFLCCETGKYIGPHLTNPLFLYLAFDDEPWTVLLIVFFEVVETMLPVIFGQNDFAFGDPNDLETHAASLIGDVLIQGGSGLLLGWLLRLVFRVPPLVSTPDRARSYNLRGRRNLYISLYLFVLASFWFAGTTTGSDLHRTGLIVQTIIQLVFIWIVWPIALANDERDEQMIWRRTGNDSFSGWKKTLFFFVWGITVLLSHSSHFAPDKHQPLFSHNEWFQQWLLTGPWIAIWIIVALVVSWQRNDTHTGLTVVGIIFVAGGIIAWFWHAITLATASAMLWLGAILVFVGVVFWLVAAFGWWDTVPVVDETRIAARTANDDYVLARASLLITETALPIMQTSVVTGTLRNRKTSQLNGHKIVW